MSTGVRGTPEQRLLALTRREGECLVWHRRTRVVPPQLRGYSGNRESAPRVAHEAWVGPIPDGMAVVRTCGNVLCVDPRHLKCVTPEELTTLWHEAGFEANRIVPDEIVERARDAYESGERSALTTLAAETGIGYANLWRAAVGETFATVGKPAKRTPRRHVLNAAQVRRLRVAYRNGENISALARDMGVGKSAAYAAASGLTWGDL